MKRYICLTCLLGLFLSACSVPEQAATLPTESGACGIYQLTFEANLISNDCVGDNWLITYTYDNQTIETGYRTTQSLEVFSLQSIDVEIREKDKIDDVGAGTLAVAICDGGTGKTEITVAENAGAFKGHTAVWEISCDVKLVGKQ